MDGLDPTYVSVDECATAQAMLKLFNHRFTNLDGNGVSDPDYVKHLKALAQLHEALKVLAGE